MIGNFSANVATRISFTSHARNLTNILKCIQLTYASNNQSDILTLSKVLDRAIAQGVNTQDDIVDLVVLLENPILRGSDGVESKNSSAAENEK